MQRAIGLEIESSPDWQAYDRKINLITGRHELLLSDPRYRLETELSGKLEFVVEPALEKVPELVAVVESIQGVALKLMKAPTKKAIGFDPFAVAHLRKQGIADEEMFHKKGAYFKTVNKQLKLLDLPTVFPGAPEVFISQTPTFPGGFQATVGIHLSAVPQLFQELKDVSWGYPEQEAMAEAGQRAEDARARSVGMPITAYRHLSPEMEGLLHLVYYYVSVGRRHLERAAFPKGITQIMARTNFAKMFSLTPESVFFVGRPAFWVDFVMQPTGLNPDDRIFRGSFGDTAADTQTVQVTYRQWLLGMLGTAKAPGMDTLSQTGGGPSILKTMGSFERTDYLGADGDDNRGVIVELRGLDAQTYPVGEWANVAQRIGKLVNALNAPNDRRMEARDAVDAAGSGSKLFWSPLPAERHVGADVLAMALEAYCAPFAAQVRGLRTRADERARLALQERQHAAT